MIKPAATAPLRKAVTVPLPPRAAFDLFTRDIDGWWPRRSPPALSPAFGRDARRAERARLRLDGGRDGTLREEEPGRPPKVWARVTVWEPGRRLVLTWSEGHGEDDEPSEVEVRFLPVDAGTRVELTHVAFGARPDTLPAAVLALFGDHAIRRACAAEPTSVASPSPSPSSSRGKVTASR